MIGDERTLPTAGHWRTQVIAPDAFDRSRWDALAVHGDVFASAAWLGAAAAMPGAAGAWLVVVVDDSGRYVAATPCWEADVSISSPHRPPGYAAAQDVSERPVLIVGSRAGYTAAFLVAQDMAAGDRRAAARLLVEGAREVSAQAGCAETWLLYASSAQCRLVDDVVDLTRFAVPATPVAEIELDGDSVEGWVSSSPREQRQTLRREQRAFTTSRLRLQQQPLRDDMQTAGRLLAWQNRKFGGRGDEASMIRYASLIGAAFGDDAASFSLYDETGEAVACSAVIAAGDTMDVRMFGAREISRAEMAYFRLTVHEPVRLAFATGRRLVSLGPGTYRSKCAHGARLSPRWAVALHNPADGARQRWAAAVDGVRAKLATGGRPTAFADLYPGWDRR